LSLADRTTRRPSSLSLSDEPTRKLKEGGRERREEKERVVRERSAQREKMARVTPRVGG